MEYVQSKKGREGVFSTQQFWDVTAVMVAREEQLEEPTLCAVVAWYLAILSEVQIYNTVTALIRYNHSTRPQIKVVNPFALRSGTDADRNSCSYSIRFINSIKSFKSKKYLMSISCYVARCVYLTKHIN